MRGREEGAKTREGQERGPRTKRSKRGCVSKMAALYRDEKLGNGKPVNWSLGNSRLSYEHK